MSSAPTSPGGGGGIEGDEGDDHEDPHQAVTAEPLIFSWKLRRNAVIYCIAATCVVVALSFFWQPKSYASGITLLTVGLPGFPAAYFSYLALRRAPEIHRPFWKWWCAGMACGAVVSFAIDLMPVVHGIALPVVAIVFGLAAAAMWGWAGAYMIRTKSGMRTISVDMVDIGLVIIAVSTPLTYLMLGKLLGNSNHWVAVLFALLVLFMPGGVYLAFVNFLWLPQGERGTQGIALLLVVVTTVDLGMQFGRSIDHHFAPYPLLAAVMVVNVCLLFLLATWARANPPVGLDRLAPQRQVRRIAPLQFVAVAVLAVLSVASSVVQNQPRWRFDLLIGALLLLSLLTALRQSVTTRETVGLYGKLEEVAAQERALLDRTLEAEAQMRELATHDYLTGLPNRRLLYDRLGQALARFQRQGHPVALLFIDLDRFKPVNDSHGHETGDTVLTIIAQRIAAVVRKSDTSARIGGDEFAVLVEGYADRDFPVEVAKRIIASVEDPIEVRREVIIHVSASIGVVVVDGDNADPDMLLMKGDAAMYAAKSAGSGRYVLH